MFDNIGGKIKTLAKVICVLGIIASVILAIVMFVAAEEGPYSTEGTYTTLGVIFLIGGPLMSRIGSFFTYGFGELIEKTTEIANNTKPIKSNQNTYSHSNNTSTPSASVTHKWVCEKCNKLTATTPCEHCGHTPTTDKKQTADELLKDGLITEEEYKGIMGK